MASRISVVVTCHNYGGVGGDAECSDGEAAREGTEVAEWL